MKTCRALFCALPLFCAVTFAQTESSQTTSSSQITSTTTTQTSGTTTPVPGQIQKWHGTLVDAACMSGGATSMAAPSVTTTTTETTSRDSSTETTETTTDTSNKRHHKEHRSRMNESSSRQTCPVSTNTGTFGLKLDDGTFLKFDPVGNTRAASELNAKQKWTKELGENKPIHAKVNGIPNGDTIIVTDIH